MICGTFLGIYQRKQLKKMTEFQRQIGDGYVIERINLSSATVTEASKFKAYLDEDIDLGYKTIIIDLGDCNSFDPAFMGVLVITLKQLERLGGSVKIVKHGLFSNSLLNLTGTIEIFELYESTEHALGSFPDLPQKNVDFHTAGLDNLSLVHQN